MSVDTTKAQGRRTLRFQSLDDVLADADRLADAPVRSLGNWSLGQICKHLAESMNQSIDGFEFQASLPVRMVARLIKGRYLKRGFTPGFKLPRRAVRLLPPPIDTQEGLAALRAGVERLKRETRRSANPVFGPLTAEEWNQLHLRHSELHLSFIVPA
jgi:hypothetical protein